MKRHFILIIALGFIFIVNHQSLQAIQGVRSISGITTDWGTTKYLDELYALKLGWTIVYLDRNEECYFEKISWDEIDSEGALFKFLLNEADLNKDRNVTRAEAAKLLKIQKATMCINAKRKKQ